MIDMTEAQAPVPSLSAAPGSLPSLGPIAREPPLPAGSWGSFLIGFRIGRQRLRRRRVVLLALLGLALAIAGAIIERRVTSAGAVDRSLVATFRLVIPLVTFAVVTEASARSRLREATWSGARFGAGHRDAALGLVAAAVLTSTVLSAVFAIAAVVCAHAPGSPPLVADGLLSAWIAVVVAFAYAGWFAFGSTFLKLGRGRYWPLALDFIIGGSTGLAGAILPRGNAMNLLGGAQPLDLTQPASMGILIASGVALCVASAMRCRQ